MNARGELYRGRRGKRDSQKQKWPREDDLKRRYEIVGMHDRNNKETRQWFHWAS